MVSAGHVVALMQVVAAATTASLYNLSARDINGQLVPLNFEGNVSVVMNVATF